MKGRDIQQRLSTGVRQRTLLFFGHVVRSDNNLEILVIQGKVNENGPSFGRALKWPDQESTQEIRGITIPKAEDQAQKNSFLVNSAVKDR